MTFFDFTKSYEKIVKIEKSIVLNLRNRPSLIERDESTSKVDSELRKNFQECELELDKTIKEINNSEKNPSAFSITEREIERRRNMVNELKNHFDSNYKIFNEMLNKRASFKKPINRISDTDLLFENSSYKRVKNPDYSQMNKTQLIELQNNSLADQEKHIDDLTNTVTNIGRIGKTIGNHLEEDIKLLGKLEEGIDKNTGKMEKTQQNLSNFLKKTSNCCLLMIIAAELIIFVLLLGIL